MKRYLNQNVYDATQERLDIIFSDFERVCVSFSGGKESGVLLNLVLDYVRQHKIKNKIGVLLIDLEGQYNYTIDYALKMYKDNADLIEPYWICLPLNLRNSVSMYEPYWCCWEPGKEDKWIRPMPDFPVIKDQDYFPFYRYRMEFEEFVPEFNKWFAAGKKGASLVAIRSDESLNRFRTIASKTKIRYKDHNWTTVDRDAPNVVSAFPIYDWRVEDIWIGNGKNEWPYNKVYDMFYRAGVSLSNMRLCQPYGDDQRIGLDLYRIIEPETWAKVVNRVSGANFGNIYCGTKVLGYHKVQLPEGHTWKSYTKLLLASLPSATRDNYKSKFCKFMRYWNKKGCGLPDDAIDNLPASAVVTNRISNRGHKDKKVVRYKKIEDHLDRKIESRHHAPTWRRMAMCILKNDHMCKTLSYAQTKNQSERQKELMEKYRSL